MLIVGLYEQIVTNPTTKIPTKTISTHRAEELGFRKWGSPRPAYTVTQCKLDKKGQANPYRFNTADLRLWRLHAWITPHRREQIDQLNLLSKSRVARTRPD